MGAFQTTLATKYYSYFSQQNQYNYHNLLDETISMNLMICKKGICLMFLIYTYLLQEPASIFIW